MFKKMGIIIMCCTLFLCSCKNAKKNNSSDTSAYNSSTNTSDTVSQSEGDKIEVRPAGELGNGSAVNNVHIAASGATVISISKNKNNGNSSYSSGTSSDPASSGTASSTPGSNDPYEDISLDFVLDYDTKNVNILQLSDFMVIDSAQQRPETRMGEDESQMYKAENIESLLFKYIKDAVDKSNPDLILITGDLVMGFYDDLGTSFEAVINYLDSLKIFWAPVFGSYDNASAQGVKWQSEKLEKSSYCLFKRNNSIGGNSNYTVGIGCGGKLSRVIYMIDSNGCVNSTDPAVNTTQGFTEQQLQWMRSTKAGLTEKDYNVPSFVCFNQICSDILDAAINAGYDSAENTATYEIGKDVTSKNRDFGVKGEAFTRMFTDDQLLDTFKSIGVDGVFMGSNPKTDISILYDNIRWTIGMKTGTYYLHSDRVGGMLIAVSGNNGFKVSELLYN